MTNNKAARKTSETSMPRVEFRASPGNIKSAIAFAEAEGISPGAFHRRLWEIGLLAHAENVLKIQQALSIVSDGVSGD